MTNNVLSVEHRFYTPEQDSLKEMLRKNDLLRWGLMAVFGISIPFCILLAFRQNSAMAYFVFESALIALFCLVYFFFGSEKKESNESVVENVKGKEYLLCLGYIVKQFYGDAVKSAKKQGNRVAPLLINAEVTKRHLLTMATIGAGKTVLMKGLIEQLAIAGGGGLIIDGKGTAEFAKEVYGLFVRLGREDDFFHLNFLDMNHTHTINPLSSGNAMSLYEMMIMLLVGDENEWKERSKEYMKNILKLLVYKRDYENMKLDFSEVANILPLESLAIQALEYRKKAREFVELEDFVQFVSTMIGIDYQRFLKEESEEFAKEVKKASKNFDIQGVYNASVAVESWRSVITNLKSDYGRIFNAPNPNISLWEATQKNKFIFVTLPTMSSDTTPRQIGTLILGLIKNVAQDKAAKATEPKIPFMCFCDELGSYVVEGVGRLESKSRSIGISMMPFFQSPSQIDAVGKSVGSESLERREIGDVTGVTILMKNMHPETTEFYAKFVPKVKRLVKNYSARRFGAKGAGSVEDSFNIEEEDAFKHDEVVKMSNGEMMVFAAGKMYRAIAQAESTLLEMGKKTTYEGRDMEKPIPLTEYLDKNEFFESVQRFGGATADKICTRLLS